MLARQNFTTRLEHPFACFLSLGSASECAHSGARGLQELQNSILDLNRQLEEAKERESTLLAVERQHKADAASLTSQMNAAEQRAADTEHRLALTSTELKVSPVVHSLQLEGNNRKRLSC